MKPYRAIIPLLFILGAAGSPAEGWHEPGGIMGHPWGSSPWELNISGCTVEECWTVISLGSLPAVGISFYFDADGGLDGARLWGVRQKSYPILRAVMVEEYGEPTSTESSEVRMPEGAMVSSEVVTWVGQKVSIRLQERCEPVTISCASIGLKTSPEREDHRKSKKGGMAFKEKKWSAARLIGMTEEGHVSPLALTPGRRCTCSTRARMRRSDEAG